jgi:hypothetical protein
MFYNCFNCGIVTVPDGSKDKYHLDDSSIETCHHCCETTAVYKYISGSIYLRVSVESGWLSIEYRQGRYKIRCGCGDSRLENEIMDLVDPDSIINDGNNAAKMFTILKGAIECSAFK